MAALFIDVQVAAETAKNPELAKKLEEVCPVGIFKAEGGALQIVEDNLDECTLCDLCIQAAPDGQVRVIKRYEQ